MFHLWFTLYFPLIFSIYTAPTGYPQNIRSVASDSSTLHIYWNPPNLEERNGDIVHYAINITEVESGKTTQYLTTDSTSSYVVSGLLSYQFYQYTVTAFTAIGHGPYSPIQSIQMPPAGELSDLYLGAMR